MDVHTTIAIVQPVVKHRENKNLRQSIVVLLVHLSMDDKVVSKTLGRIMWR